MTRLLAVLCLTLAVAAPAMPAHAAVGDWVENGHARIRLVAAGTGREGKLNAALEIELQPGWTTYWRTPGDAGIAPVIDLSASRNIGQVDVAFPVPERHDDGYSVTNVYTDRVVLPLSAALVDPAAGVDLSLKLDIGVCSDVCVPDHFEAALDLPVGDKDAEAGQIIDAARKALPGSPEPGVFAVNRVKRDGGTDRKPQFALTATVPDPENAVVFVEGAPDWFPDIPRLASRQSGRAVYRFTFDTLGSQTPLAAAKVRVTIVSGSRAIEQWVALE